MEVTQPMLITFSNGQIFLKLDNEYAKISSSNFTNALDLLFKSFTVLNVEYPPQAINLYKFIEIIIGINRDSKYASFHELNSQLLSIETD